MSEFKNNDGAMGEDARRSVVFFFLWIACRWAAYFFGLKSRDAEFIQ